LFPPAFELPLLKKILCSVEIVHMLLQRHDCSNSLVRSSFSTYVILVKRERGCG
jgi:hypothetical protein